eukprot:7388233-Prymnesium_polylepis.1
MLTPRASRSSARPSMLFTVYSNPRRECIWSDPSGPSALRPPTASERLAASSSSVLAARRSTGMPFLSGTSRRARAARASAEFSRGATNPIVS